MFFFLILYKWTWTANNVFAILVCRIWVPTDYRWFGTLVCADERLTCLLPSLGWHHHAPLQYSWAIPVQCCVSDSSLQVVFDLKTWCILVKVAYLTGWKISAFTLLWFHCKSASMQISCIPTGVTVAKCLFTKQELLCRGHKGKWRQVQCVFPDAQFPEEVYQGVYILFLCGSC